MDSGERQTERRVENEVVLKVIELLRGKYTVTTILRVLDVPRATYYRWVKELVKHPSVLEQTLVEVCKHTKYRYGHRKIKALLEQSYKLTANRNTVQRIMKKHHLQCRIKPKRKWKYQGESIIIAPDLLKLYYNKSMRRRILLRYLK